MCMRVSGREPFVISKVSIQNHDFFRAFACVCALIFACYIEVLKGRDVYTHIIQDLTTMPNKTEITWTCALLDEFVCPSDCALKSYEIRIQWVCR